MADNAKGDSGCKGADKVEPIYEELAKKLKGYVPRLCSTPHKGIVYPGGGADR